MAQARTNILGFTVVLAILFTATRVHAGIPGFFTASADSNGVTISYLLPLLGARTVAITPDQPATIDIKLLNNPLATITLSMTGVSDMPEGARIHYVLEGPSIPVTEGDVTIPFGELGVEMNFFGILPMLPGNNDIEVTLLLLKNRASYYITAETRAFVIEPWSGTATPAAPTITRQITVHTAEGDATADISATFSWDIPATTGIAVDVALQPILQGDLPAGFDNDTLMPPIQVGPVQIPNGSYHLWFRRGSATD
ncbi:MAG: hypothetical protein N3B18_11950 [Desulfobacterota bacterium]|nr:hypothetical protein [Thermodesulfobacteriota bacterium]